jgi:hypothetical protein
MKMKRYFQIEGERQVVELDISDGSLAATATPEQLGQAMKVELKEITNSQYRRLSVQFAQ